MPASAREAGGCHERLSRARAGRARRPPRGLRTGSTRPPPAWNCRATPAHGEFAANAAMTAARAAGRKPRDLAGSPGRAPPRGRKDRERRSRRPRLRQPAHGPRILAGADPPQSSRRGRAYGDFRCRRPGGGVNVEYGLRQPDRAPACRPCARRRVRGMRWPACLPRPAMRSPPSITSTMPGPRWMRSAAPSTTAIWRRWESRRGRWRRTCIRALTWSRSAGRSRRNSAAATAAPPNASGWRRSASAPSPR